MRMKLPEFNKLVELLRDKITVSDVRAEAATPTGALCPEQRLALTLQFLGGAPYQTLVDIFSVGVTSVYDVIWHTIGAINSCEELRPKIDLSEAACRQRAARFAAKSSSQGVFVSAMGAVSDDLVPRRYYRSARVI